jgi:hypothetical protein
MDRPALVLSASDPFPFPFPFPLPFRLMLDGVVGQHEQVERDAVHVQPFMVKGHAAVSPIRRGSGNGNGNGNGRRRTTAQPLAELPPGGTSGPFDKSFNIVAASALHLAHAKATHARDRSVPGRCRLSRVAGARWTHGATGGSTCPDPAGHGEPGDRRARSGGPSRSGANDDLAPVPPVRGAGGGGRLGRAARGSASEVPSRSNVWASRCSRAATRSGWACT